MNKASFAVILASLVSVVSVAAAASSASGMIGDVTIESNDGTGADAMARISIGTTAVGGRPACHNSGYSTHYSIDVGTPKGKTLYNTAITALANGHSVSGSGTGSCYTVASGLTIERLNTLTVWN